MDCKGLGLGFRGLRFRIETLTWIKGLFRVRVARGSGFWVRA